MNYKKTCECCGNVVSAYTHSLNVSLVIALRKLVDQYETRVIPIPLGDLDLATSQYTNFAHLQYFHLAQNMPDGWVPTKMGIQFIYGEARVMVPAGVFGKEILWHGHEAWETHTAKRAELFVYDIDAVSYKRRNEYQREKASTLSLF